MSACSNPVLCVPPFGVAMMLTKLRTFVSYPVPQRRAMSTPHSRATSWLVMWPVLSSSTGTVSVNDPLPCRRQMPVTAASGARYSQNSLMPPSCRNVSSWGPFSPGVPAMPRSSRMTMARPGTRKLV